MKKNGRDANELVKKRSIVRMDLFKGKTFAFNKDCFAPDTDFSKMEKTILEYGGRVIECTRTPLFLIQDDGYDPEVWKKNNQKPSIVHFRYIE